VLQQYPIYHVKSDVAMCEAVSSTASTYEHAITVSSILLLQQNHFIDAVKQAQATHFLWSLCCVAVIFQQQMQVALHAAYEDSHHITQP
jgi:hypothetical protein